MKNDSPKSRFIGTSTESVANDDGTRLSTTTSLIDSDKPHSRAKISALRATSTPPY